MNIIGQTNRRKCKVRNILSCLLMSGIMAGFMGYITTPTTTVTTCKIMEWIQPPPRSHGYPGKPFDCSVYGCVVRLSIDNYTRLHYSECTLSEYVWSKRLDQTHSIGSIISCNAFFEKCNITRYRHSPRTPMMFYSISIVLFSMSFICFFYFCMKRVCINYQNKQRVRVSRYKYVRVIPNDETVSDSESESPGDSMIQSMASLP